jgi:hypothetical protein
MGDGQGATGDGPVAGWRDAGTGLKPCATVAQAFRPVLWLSESDGVDHPEITPHLGYHVLDQGYVIPIQLVRDIVQAGRDRLNGAGAAE